ncbi:C-C motif chemokine 19a.1 [Boleophthalmus pectinirostris]|uniref:C-C motif chemokine 19a.1 n=1 Tax=Boleophthalmus pectinirostris TaxID=150288 RepID=UPI000A1C5931|nr:C-C motif chemokine 19a.1 [Boleophthalmus pectinirostris]
MSASVHVPRVPFALLVFVLTVCCCCSVAVGQIAMDCCLQVRSKEVPKAAVVDYWVQVAGQGCAIDAVILVTREGRSLCVPPSQPKLNQILSHVEKLRKHCKKTGYKGKRCSRVKHD